MRRIAPLTIVLLGLTGLALAVGFWWLPAWMLGSAIGAYVAIRMVMLSIREREFGSDILALLSIAATALTGEWLAAAIVSFMLTSGQALESWAAGKAKQQLEALAQRAPRDIHIVDASGNVTVTALANAKIGDRFVVATGEVVALDGTLQETAVFDESALTGEPVPQTRNQGEVVSSGVVNVGAAVQLIATTDAETSTYAALVRLVQSVKGHSAPRVRVANRWALWFVPLSLVMAALTWLFSGNIQWAIAVIVAATPCPLILAVPIAIISGISNSAKHGAIIKDGSALEALSRVKVMLVDKTGTLTVGAPAVSGVQVAPGTDPDQVLAYAAALELSSAHVLAKAVVTAARDSELEIPRAENVLENLGEGLTGTIDGRSITVGRFKQTDVDWVQSKASLQIAVSVENQLLGVIDLNDPVRPESIETVKRLRRLGIERVVLVTGDREPAARVVADAVGVDELHAECRPEQKLEILQFVRDETHKPIVVVGDGINDAPALAAADVGIALGARGATAASETADVVIVEDSIARVADAISVSQGAMNRAVQAAGVGMSLSLVAMLLGAFGITAPTENALIQELIDASAILWALVPPKRF